MVVYRRGTLLLALLVGAAFGDGPPATMATEATLQEEAPLQEAVGRDCPPMAFVKRHHLGRPFGVGTIYCWNVYKPGGGIYVYDPAHRENAPREVFRREGGVVFDMSPSYDGKRLLFSWMAIEPDDELKL